MAELYTTSLISDGNLQGYWRLESDGTDSGPNSYTLAPGNAPEGYVSAKFGNGGDFESSASDYLTIAGASCPNLNITGSQSWGAWVKIESIPATSVILGKSNTGYTVYNMLFYQTNGTAGFRLNGLSGTSQAVTSAGAVSAGSTWWFLVGTYNSSDGKIAIWVNNVKTETTLTGTPSSNTNSFQMSSLSSSVAFVVDGIIDDAFVFNKKLTDDEIALLYNDGVPPVTGVSRGFMTTNTKFW